MPAGAGERRLLIAHASMARNAVTATAARRGSALIVGVLLAGAEVVAWRASAGAFNGDPPSPSDVESSIARICGALVAFTLVTGITFALGALYFARDLEGLHASPIHARTIVGVKVAVQLVTGLAIGSLFVLPPLGAYLAALGVLWAAPAIVCVIAALTVIPLLVGTAAAVAVVKVVPATRIRDAAGILATLAFVVSVGANLAIRGPGGFTSGLPGGQFLARTTTPVDSPWLPTGWAARSCVRLAEADLTGGVLWALPLVLLAAGLAVAVPRLVAGWYVQGWQDGREASRGRTRRRVRARRRTRPPIWAVIALKDLRCLRGDGQQLAQLILPVLMFGVYLAGPSGFGATRLPAWYGSGLTACFAAMFVSSGMALRSVGLEGQSFWVLRVSPVPAQQVLTAKLAAGFGVAGTFAAALFTIGTLRGGDTPLGLGLLDVLTATFGLCALAVGLGAARPRLDWTDPRRAIGLATSFGYLVLGGGFLVAVFTAVAFPYAVGGSAFAVLLGQTAAALVAASTSAVALAVGRRRLATLEL